MSDEDTAPGFESVTRLRINPRGREHEVTSCHCVGPRGNQPYCPCRMRLHGVERRDGRWVIPGRDLGPAGEDA